MWMEESGDSPAEAEESQVEAQQRGHHVSDEGTGLAGVEVDPKPHSHQEGKQLTRHEVNLRRGTYGHYGRHRQDAGRVVGSGFGEPQLVNTSLSNGQTNGAIMRLDSGLTDQLHQCSSG